MATCSLEELGIFSLPESSRIPNLQNPVFPNSQPAKMRIPNSHSRNGSTPSFLVLKTAHKWVAVRVRDILMEWAERVAEPDPRGVLPLVKGVVPRSAQRKDAARCKSPFLPSATRWRSTKMEYSIIKKVMLRFIGPRTMPPIPITSAAMIKLQETGYFNATGCPYISF